MSKVDAVLNDDGITVTSGFKQVYNYLRETGEYTGTNEEYLQVGVGIPALSTLLPAPACGEKEAVVFSVDENVWTIMPDYRGMTAYSTSNGEPISISNIGPIPENTTFLKPNSAADDWNGECWVECPEKAKQLQIEAANTQKNTLLAYANTQSNSLALDYNLGLLDDEQISELKQWRVYIRSLNDIDTSLAPDIDWPVSPEIQSS